jgi:hypothetical protein
LRETGFVWVPGLSGLEDCIPSGIPVQDEFREAKTTISDKGFSHHRPVVWCGIHTKVYQGKKLNL